MKKISIIAALLCTTLGSTLSAQEQTLYFANELWQSNLANPAFMTQKKFNLCLPSLYANISTPVTINDFVIQRNGQKLFSIGGSNWLNKLGTNNTLLTEFNVQSAALSLPLSKKLRLSIHHMVRTSNTTTFGDAFAKILINGNAPYAGQTLNLDLGLRTSAINELGFSFAYQVNDNITIGARYKYLNGIGGGFTEGNRLSVYTDTSTYALTINSDYKIYTFGDTAVLNDPSQLLKINKGASFDVGATIKMGKLNVSAAILDLNGVVNWKNGDTYVVNANNVRYSGINDYDNADSGNSADSLKQKFGYSESLGTTTYTQKLPLRAYIGGTLQVTDKFRVGALFNTESLSKDTKFNATIDGTVKVAKIMYLGASAGLRNKSFNNLGMHASLRLAFLQVYFVTDNILGLAKYAEAKNFNGRAGVNLTF